MMIVQESCTILQISEDVAEEVLLVGRHPTQAIHRRLIELTADEVFAGAQRGLQALFGPYGNPVVDAQLILVGDVHDAPGKDFPQQQESCIRYLY